MMDCDEARELIPWYVTGTLSPMETRRLAAHLARCPRCRDELAETVRLSFEVNSAISRLPDVPDDLKQKVTAIGGEIPVTHVDLGSFLLGLSLGLSVKGGRVPVQGDLRLLGRKVRLFRT